MAHTYVHSLFHCVFSTKERRAMLASHVRSRLWPFIGGIARKNEFAALAVGGTEDHVHLLLSLPATLAQSHAVDQRRRFQVHDTFPEHHAFAWQEGYGAFSLGISDVRRTIA